MPESTQPEADSIEKPQLPESRLDGQGRNKGARTAGHWYMPDAELYHLEDQSYPKDVRKRVTGYNKWLQTELWGEEIQLPMGAHSGLEG